MLKPIRYILLFVGSCVTIYGFVRDTDLITFIGVFIFIIAFMLREILKIITNLK